MYRFAQNYPQLMNQAAASGFSDAELIRLHEAFDVALRMADGIYRSQGVPLLNHLTSTASIVLSEGQDSELVTAALLHAAFVLQQFDDNTRSRNLQKRRDDISRQFGNQIEDLVWSYEKMPWYKQGALDQWLAGLDTHDSKARRLLTLRLANELDDNLDNAVGYSALEKTGMRSLISLDKCRQLARALGLDLIAAEFTSIIDSQHAPIDPIRWKRKQGYQLQDRRWDMSAIERTRYHARRQAGRLKRRLSGWLGRLYQ